MSIFSSRRLVIAALGVVFGDIATSPLYALQSAFDAHGVAVNRLNVFGLLSLTVWALILMVSIKYIAFIMRANNQGEGGIMSLLALAQTVSKGLPHAVYLCVVGLGLGGAAFFFGDSVITPAVSVISAVEGLKLALPQIAGYIVPISVLILVGLFVVQHFGSSNVGRIFGPVMTLWLIAIGVLGVYWLCKDPAVLASVNPRYAALYLARNGFRGFETLGAVVLVLTGAEALYADMGHFGARPIRIAWFALVLPCLLLNYFGQAALLLGAPDASDLLFFRMVPHLALLPMLALAAVATVIASQAVIVGAFSMAREAMLLGFLPRMSVVHTSAVVKGQVYLPGINGLLFIAVIVATLLFQTSDALSAAYGIAVSGTMLATTVLAFLVARRAWGWSYFALVPMAAVLLPIDCAFFLANMIKIQSGGWFPLVLGVTVFVVMLIWRRGRAALVRNVNRDSIELEPFIRSLVSSDVCRAEGTAIFLTARNSGVPTALLHNLKHNQVLHQVNILVRVENLEIPRAAPGERVEVSAVGDGFYQVTVRFGFSEATDVPLALSSAKVEAWRLEDRPPTYFVSRGQVFATRLTTMMSWQAGVFAFLARNALPATSHFQLPEDRMIEIGLRVDI